MESTGPFVSNGVSKLNSSYGYTPSLTVGGSPTADEWKNWFGAPPRPIDTNPYDGYAQSSLALPEAYHGNNPYITRMLFQMISEEDLWAINYALPFRREEKRIEIKWEIIEFNNALLNAVPEEGTSRLVTQQRQEKSEFLTRYGLGFQVEHGFMNSEFGRQSYMMHLKQIKNAVLQTAYYQVLSAYLRCKTAGAVWQMRYGRTATLAMLKKARDNEVEEFGLVQKVENGFNNLHSRLKKDMSMRNNVEPNMWILKEGVLSYLSNVRRENYAYFLKGPEGPQMFKSGLAANGSKDIATINECMIFEAKSMEMNNNSNEVIDPLVSTCTIGEFYPMMPHVDLTSNYTSSQRSVTLFDAQKDGFTKVSLSDSLEACPRFNRDGSLNFDDVPVDLCPNDPFVYQEGNSYAPVMYFGDMKPEFVKDKVLTDFAATVLSVFDDNRRNELRAHLEDGLRMIQEIEDISTVNNASQNKYFAWVQNNYPTFNGSIDNVTGLLDVPIPGMEKLDATDFTADGPKFIPCGYSTFAGMQVLAKPINKAYYRTYQERAEKFVNAISELYSRVSLTCLNTIFCDPMYQPSYLIKPDGRNTLVSNIVTLPQPPIVVTGASTGNKEIKIENNLFQAGDRTKFETDLRSKERFANLFNEAFDGSNALVDDYLRTSNFNGLRMGKLEALYAALLSSVASTEKNGKSTLKDVSKFDPKSDNPFKSGDDVASTEEIAICRDVVGSLISTLKRVGIDSGVTSLFGSANFNIAYEIAILIAGLRFGTLGLKPQTIIGLFSGLVHVPDYESMVKYIEAANETFKEYVADPKLNIRENLGIQLARVKLLSSPDDEFSDMRSVRTSSSKGQIKVLPLAGSQKIMEYCEANVSGLSVGNDGNYGKFSGAASRSVRHTYASFDLNNSTLAQRPRYTEVGFDRDQDYLDNDYEDDGMRSRFMSRSDKRQRTQSGWKMGYGSGPSQQGGRRNNESAKHFGEGMTVAFSTNFVERFRDRVSVENDIITRCIYSCFLGCTVHRNTLRNFIEKNVVFPFSFVLLRPYIEFRMAAGILAKAGRETGETLIGHHNFMIGDDAVRKIHHGNFTMYMAPVIYNEKNCHIQRDMCFDTYVRGMDCSFVTNKTQHDAYVHSGEGGRSIYSILEPYDGAENMMKHNPIDLSGQFTGKEKNSYDGALLYSSAEWYNNYFQWTEDTINDPNESIFYAARRNNSVCYSGYTGLYNHVTMQNDLIIMPTGHLGSVYQGVVRVWNGRMNLYKSVTYPYVYGGASQVNNGVIIA